MKKIVLIGGAGTIGHLLAKGLKKTYDIVIIDKNINSLTNEYQVIQADATNYQELSGSIPTDAEVLINLLKTGTDDSIEEIETFHQMNDVFFKSTYYLLDIAVKKKIPKVVFASSNHVTDFYEEEGKSLLGREIEVGDYPLPRGLYGVLKLASEELGFIFSLHCDLSVINLRIGSVPGEKGKHFLQEKSRLKKTLLTEEDTVELFQAAIEADIKFGIYYGVSDNPGKPWDMSTAISDMGFSSIQNTEDILDTKRGEK